MEAPGVAALASGGVCAAAGEAVVVQPGARGRRPPDHQGVVVGCEHDVAVDSEVVAGPLAAVPLPLVLAVHVEDVSVGGLQHEVGPGLVGLGRVARAGDGVAVGVVVGGAAEGEVRLDVQIGRSRERDAGTVLDPVGVFDQRSREYRCWVSLDGNEENTHCFIYDGAGWRERDDMVVDMCARNVRANGLAAADSIDPSIDLSTRRGSVEVARLAWGDEEDVAAAEAWVAAARGIEPGTKGCAKAYPDVLLLADVVYGEHPDAWRGLVRTIAALAGPGTAVLLSHTRRGDSKGAQRKFFDWLKDAGFVVEAVERWKGTRDGFASLTLLYRAYRYGSTTLGRSYSVVK